MPKKDAYLITLETSGNQPYIFSSNKLRDVVGASELIYRVGKSYVERAIEEAAKRVPDVTKTGDDGIEVVIAASGLAVLLAASLDTAKRFVTAWSRLVVQEAPGVDALAACSEKPLDLSAPLDDPEKGYSAVFRDAGKNQALLKARRANALSRFQRIPVVAPCAFSGFPAEALVHEKAAARVTRAKMSARDSEGFKDRMRSLFPDGKSAAADEPGLAHLEGLEWLAVVHADGNGLGQILTEFGESVEKLIRQREGRAATGRDYVDLYRNFSRALDRISEGAFRKTVDEIWPEEAEVVPIVVGGDDLTAVMDGRRAIRFAKRYMENFCAASAGDGDILPILENGGEGLRRIGMCAGICVTKPHFPFSASYRLAEELMQSAKAVKEHLGKDAIALDFHILYDSVATSMDDIRGKLQFADNVSLTAKPFVLPDPETEKNGWAKVHSYEKFARAVSALTRRGRAEKDGEQPPLLLPSSQSHAMRDALFTEHVPTQEADWAYLLGRYKGFAEEWGKVSGCGELYATGTVEEKELTYTYFLDALEASNFMETPEEGGGQDA